MEIDSEKDWKVVRLVEEIGFKVKVINRDEIKTK